MRRAALLLALASGLLWVASGAMEAGATASAQSASGARGAQISPPAVPRLTGRVVDLADILSPATETALTARLRALEDSTTEQIAVLTVPSLNGEDLETWATQVFRTWGLGQADQDNGVLLLIARDDRKIRIEVGYGLEALLTDATAGRIIRDEMTPRFRDGDFDGGTLGAVEAIIGSLDGTYVSPEAPGSSESPVAVVFTLLFVVLIPTFGAASALFSPPVQRYVALFAVTAMFAGAGGIVGDALLGVRAGPAALATALSVVLLFVALDVLISRSPKLSEVRAHRARKIEAFKRARKSGRTSVVVDGKSYTVPTGSSSSGGFSGGGGSSGGGGASGGW